MSSQRRSSERLERSITRKIWRGFLYGFGTRRELGESDDLVLRKERSELTKLPRIMGREEEYTVAQVIPSLSPTALICGCSGSR